MFKHGDKVVKNNGICFSNGKEVNTVDYQEGCKVWIIETSSWVEDRNISLVNSHADIINKLENMLSAKKDEVAKLENAIEVLKTVIQ